MMKRLTTTSYLVLGLLATGDWSAYELVEQLGKGVGEVWRRADRQLYDTPKRLVDLGLITARTETSAGRRTRTVYSIAQAGRTALANWIGSEIQPSAMQFDGLVRVLLADQGDVEQLRSTLHAIADQARVRRDLFVSHANYAIASNGGSMPERAHLFALANRYMIEHFSLMTEWAEWALAQVADWPDTVSPATTHREESAEIFGESARMVHDRTHR